MTLWRLIRIAWVVTRYRLDSLIPAERLPGYARFLMAIAPIRLFPKGDKTRGERLRLALEDLGPIFIKFGQMLSTRRDLMPPDIAVELKRLQDQVPPFHSDTARHIIEEELGAPVGELFDYFEADSMASASIAQVHAARLHTGEEVVIKVIRPGIDSVMRNDIALLYTFARVLLKIWPEARRLRPVEVVKDYESTLFDELDLQKEAANTSQLKRNFQHSPLLHVPTIYWPQTRKRVMTQERVNGVPVADTDALEAQGVDMRLLAERGVEIFFTQVFRDNFFHADMHPGNIFVDISNPSDPSYIAIDCGIVGSLTREDQDYLARNIIAFFRQDYYEVAMLHIESGWVGEHTRANEFAAAIRSVCEPILEKPLKDISFGQVLMGLFQTAQRFHMEVQPQLVLLQKTLLNIEGLGRTLYPELDLWHTAKPFLERWMHERAGPKGFWEELKRQAPDLAQRIPQLPVLAHQALSQVENERKHREQQTAAFVALQNAFSGVRKGARRIRIGLVLIAGALAWQPISQWAMQQHWSILAAAGIGLALVIWR